MFTDRRFWTTLDTINNTPHRMMDREYADTIISGESALLFPCIQRNCPDFPSRRKHTLSSKYVSQRFADSTNIRN